MKYVEPYILSLDVGTTSVRCFVFDEQCRVKGTASELVTLLNPKPGYFEIEPNGLWQSILNVIKNSIKDANLKPTDITCLGISSQRCSFITWHSVTKEYFHNFITWKDMRSDDLVTKWNNGYLLKTLNSLSYALYTVTRSNRFLAASVLKTMNGQITLRLLFEIQNNEKLNRALKENNVVYATLDTWILHKLKTGNDKLFEVDHVSDITSCTPTGIFDPFVLEWSKFALSTFGINANILPKVVDNSHNFGYVNESLFGAKIRIASSISDQSASLWGSCCFEQGDIKVTLGTGSFLNLITGAKCNASTKGLYPLVAWKFNKDVVYCIEGSANDTGSIINWGLQCGFFNDPSKSSEMAESVPNSDGVFFVPAFSGIGPPVNDYKTASGFLGIRPTTTKNHLVRSLLESIVFRIAQIVDCVKAETNYELKYIRVDGGVSKNNFICQNLADITGIIVERSLNCEASVVGSAYVAGINIGIWQSKEEIKSFRKVENTFEPRLENQRKLLEKIKLWENVIERFKGWYDK